MLRNSLPRSSGRVFASLVFLCVAFAAGTASAQAPPEVTGLTIAADGTLSWDPAAGADDYNVYRGSLAQLRGGVPPRCHGDEIASTSFASPGAPPTGDGFLYLVTAEAAADEGTPGSDSDATERALLGRCDPVMRHHILDRVAYGWDEWSGSRLDTLGAQGFIDEQLDPVTIDESTNTALNDRLGPIDPPADARELRAQFVVRAAYARRQLEQIATIFWMNHFNTEFPKTRNFFNNRQGYTDTEINQLTADAHYDEMQSFRDLAFNGLFREIVETSGKSVPMLIFLDTNDNTASRPNENYARELLELHTMGVDNGYTQQDVEELARVWSGWNVCKKTDANAADPLAPCIPRIFESINPGVYVANFRPNQHDPGQKILFAGTPYETVIPDTSANPDQGLNDVEIALDAIAAHPSTPQFISKKLLEKFVTDEPTQAMIDDIVSRWDATGGDLREVLREVVNHSALRTPDQARSKLRTPLEHVTAAMRGVRGQTDGFRTVQSYLIRMAHVPHYNPVPTGYPERGADWIDTNNILERQNFGLDVALSTDPNFGSDLIALMNANGLDLGSPPADIVAFWADVLFAGALTPAELAEAETYLTTDDLGQPDPVLTEDRVRETVGFMLGYAQFQEQ